MRQICSECVTNPPFELRHAGPVTLGNPKPLDCNIHGIRFLPQGKFYPLPCGQVGRAPGTKHSLLKFRVPRFNPTRGDRWTFSQVGMKDHLQRMAWYS